MSMTPPTLPQAVNLVHVRLAERPRGEPGERRLLLRLRQHDEPAAWRAAVLALTATAGSGLERQALQELTQGLADASRLFDDLAQLSQTQRLPWFEHFARQLAPGAVELRQELIGATRRLMTADGVVTPLDQLRWIALRHLLAGSAVAAPAAAPTEFETLEYDEVHAICVFCAFLSALVPTPEVTVDLTGYGSVSQDWYAAVTAPWLDRTDVPAREGHDIDAAMRALRVLQAMPWLLRPVLVRAWFDAARALTDGPALHPGAADALRLSCLLLDCPVPPELGQQYIEVDPRH